MLTKIINVLKDDRFEDILEIFKRAPAGDVIFVLPRKNNALNTEFHFTTIAEAAERQNKNILILTSDPTVTEMALRFNFGLLTSEKRSNSGTKKYSSASSKEKELGQKAGETKNETQTEIIVDSRGITDLKTEESDLENAESVSLIGSEERLNKESGNESEENDDKTSVIHQEAERRYHEVELIAAAATAKRSRPTAKIAEIATVEDEIKVKTSRKPEQPEKIGLKGEGLSSLNQRALDEIQNVWRFRPNKSTGQKSERSFTDPVKTFIPSRTNKPSFLNFRGRILTLFGIVVVIVLGIAIYITAGSARVTIKPKTHGLDSVFKISASDHFQSVDIESKNIPGQFFLVEKKVEETFQATGEKNVIQKARGKIIVYNKYGTTPQILIATTRFESPGGFIFRTLKTITIPGTKVQNGQIIPGTVEVEVIADKAGDSYNIDPGKFTIPAFREKGDLDRFEKFYGVSEEPIRGGIIGKAKVVTEQDFVNAKKTVEERLIKETEQDLKNQTSGLKILTSSQASIKEINSTAQIDEAADTFTVSGAGELQTIGFKESDLNDFLVGYIKKINDLLIFPDKLSIDFENIKFNQEEKILEFSVAVKGPAYSKIDEQKILSELYGKDEEKIKNYMKGIDSISSAKVVLSPFWVKKVPVNPDKVKIEVVY